MTGVNEALLGKIQKLMALRDKNDNENQAHAAALKIEELIAEHGINLVELEAAGKRKKEDITESRFRFHGPTHDAPEWEVILADKVSRANDCRLLVHGKTPKGANFYNLGTVAGQPHDIEVALYFYVYLRDTIWYLSLKAHREFWGKGARRQWSWLMDYGRGAAIRVGDRLITQKEAMSRSTTGSTMALVVLKDKEVADYVSKYGTAKDSYRGARDAIAEAIGWNEGGRIPLNEGVNEGAPVRRLA